MHSPDNNPSVVEARSPERRITRQAAPSPTHADLSPEKLRGKHPEDAQQHLIGDLLREQGSRLLLAALRFLRGLVRSMLLELRLGPYVLQQSSELARGEARAHRGIHEDEGIGYVPIHLLMELPQPHQTVVLGPDLLLAAAVQGLLHSQAGLSVGDHRVNEREVQYEQMDAGHRIREQERGVLDQVDEMRDLFIREDASGCSVQKAPHCLLK